MITHENVIITTRREAHAKPCTTKYKQNIGTNNSNRLNQHAETILAEEQECFRKSLITIEQILKCRIIMETCIPQLY